MIKEGNSVTKKFIHIFYTDVDNGWVAATMDENFNQIGDAEYTYRKSDAVASALLKGLPVHIFGKNGLH